MYRLRLPRIEWFVAGNIYSGSAGTDPDRGCIAYTTLRYKIKIMPQQDEKALVVICWFQLPWGKITNMEEYMIGVFETSERGISVAEEWIRRKVFEPASLECKMKDEKGNENV